MTTLRPDPLPVSDEHLNAYIDDQLEPTQRRQLEEYLLDHPLQAQRVTQLKVQRDQLRAIFLRLNNDALPDRLDIRQLVRAKTNSRLNSWRLVASVALAFCIGGYSGWSLKGGPEANPGTPGIAALSKEAMESYAVFASDPLRPVEMGAHQQNEFVRWISDRLHRPVLVPDLGASGYLFIGGRLVPTGHGPAALFVYENAHGLRLSMLVRPMKVQMNTPMQEESNGGVAGYTWADRGMGYSVLGREPASTIHPLADEIRRQTRIG